MSTYDSNEVYSCKTDKIEDIDFKELSKNCKDEKDLRFLTKQFMKNMIENMLKSEIDEHIDSNDQLCKNGYYKKSVKSDSGKLELDIPRDRKSDYTKRKNYNKRDR